jgi:imidazolonepropionase-like amidohydrolase
MRTKLPLMLLVQMSAMVAARKSKMRSIHMKISGAILATAVVFSMSCATAQSGEEPAQTLFINVNIFDGKTDGLIEGKRVLVEDNLIKAIGDDTLKADNSATVIDGDGRTLMPGMIDAHVHLHLNSLGGIPGMESTGWQELGARAAVRATDMLYDGFTTVRDMGGTDVGLKNVIDDGTMEGPRIYPSGALISQTAGHFDIRTSTMRNPNTTPYQDSNAGRLGITYVADGPDAVTSAARQNLARQATQIKLATSGGVTSFLDPLHTRQFTPEEIAAAVRVAEDWGTYVATHSISDESIRRSLAAGVKSIEHAAFMTEETAELVKENGAFIVIGTTAFSPLSLQLPQMQVEPSKSKMETVVAYGDEFKRVVNKVQPKVAFMTDVLFGSEDAARAQRDYEKWLFADFLGNYQMLRAATSVGGELMALTGELNPYPHKLGVIEEGAYADILLVDGNPLEDLSLIGASEKWFDAEPRGRGIVSIQLIMKDGIVYKNELN